MTGPIEHQHYRPRVIDQMLRSSLESAGAVLLEGPKACGKTFSAEQVAAGHVYLDEDESALASIGIDPGLVLNRAAPLLVDEWQLEATRVWNYVRRESDRRGQPGQFVLTGSAVPDDDARRHTGAGRVARLMMRPMSLYESGESTGRMSLAGLLAGERPTARSELTVTGIADLIVRGGWPLNLNRSLAAAARANRDYLRNVSEVDIARLDPSRKDPNIAMRLLRALARNVSMEQKVARLAREAEGEEHPPARTTAYDYLSVLQRLMVIEPQPAWSTHLRSRAVLRTAPRTHFCDPSLAAAALSATSPALLRDLNFLGLLFESLAVRDCRVYSEPGEATVHHYRDSLDLEIDIVVVGGSSWGAFEVKLGVSQIDAAAANLLAFRSRIDESRIGPPAVLGVITGSGYGYTRDDGVVVIPIGALGP